MALTQYLHRMRVLQHETVASIYIMVEMWEQTVKQETFDQVNPASETLAEQLAKCETRILTETLYCVPIQCALAITQF